jgi:predicted  nucleic acid-binding Zn-ribbon protein
MTTEDRAGLVARVRQIRVRVSARERAAANTPRTLDPEHIGALETRVRHLEQMVEGLQDSIHREAERHSKQISELQRQVEPAAMSASLAKDARSRGL